MFSYNPVHGVVVCHVCGSCVAPGRSGQERHLRNAPHRLLGDVLRATLRLLSSYELRTVQELREHKPRPEDHCQAIKHLASYDGFRCLQPRCGYSTRSLPKMKKGHVPSVHGIKAKERRTSQAWEPCKLQTYFTGRGRIDYFVVVVGTDDQGGRGGLRGGGLPERARDRDPGPTTRPEQQLFERVEKDCQAVRGDMAEQAGTVHGFGDSRSERVP